MENNIFRKKSIERVSSPEQLNDYIRVSNPGIWIVLVALIVLLAGVCVWGVFGHLDTTLDVVAVADNGVINVYIREADIASVDIGQSVTIADETFEVIDIAVSPISADSGIFTEYAMHVGSIQTGEWVFKVTLGTAAQTGPEIENGIYKAVIITDSVSPMSFVFN